MNSTSPWQLRSMSSFFWSANSGPSGGEPSRADIVSTARRLSSESPPERAATRFTFSDCAAGMPTAAAVASAKRSRSAASGSGMSIAVTAGDCTSRGCTSESESARSTIATFTRRRSGFVAHDKSLTSREAPPRAELATSPAGARYCAWSRTIAIRFRSSGGSTRLRSSSASSVAIAASGSRGQLTGLPSLPVKNCDIDRSRFASGPASGRMPLPTS